ncbi:MAG: S8 family serine peptidase [Paludibacteraceae bacterium]|nr:S8 family serine peptidase [Paludibacteraceae bacterium]
MSLLSILLASLTWWIQFTDKQGSSEICLSQRALDQRAAWNIAIDSLDYEVSPIYLDSLRAHGLTVMHTSRWMNGATVSGTAAQINTLLSATWITHIQPTRDNSSPNIWYSAKRINETQQNDPPVISVSETEKQLNLYHLAPLHRLGFHGQGILMCVCDGGFYNADRLSGLDSVRDQILGEFDFTDDSYDFYRSGTGSHGTECLSAIAGQQESFHGAATKAQYYLMRSEENDTESPKEMDNWIAAVEKCDSLGVNVMSTSLGYFNFDNSSWDLSYADMDGKTTRASRAALIAARKGMLVVVAAGNEGDAGWHYIDVPADADSILTVGAVDTDGNIAYFSSYGPTHDGRIKPEACAVGYRATLLDPSDSEIIHSNGTSFACPLLAGMAATLWSAIPNATAQTIRTLIIQSTDRYTNPDDQYGYGIPNAYNAYQTAIATGLVENPASESSYHESTKILIDGQIYILKDGVIYTLLGTKKAG